MLAGTPARAPATQAAPLSAGKAQPWASKGGEREKSPKTAPSRLRWAGKAEQRESPALGRRLQLSGLGNAGG